MLYDAIPLNAIYSNTKYCIEMLQINACPCYGYGIANEFIVNYIVIYTMMVFEIVFISFS